MPEFPHPLKPVRPYTDPPLYPHLMQLLRVTNAFIKGPTGGTSAGLGTGTVPPSILYIASTQQLRTDTLSPRDREPCLVVDVNNVGLSPGYYLGRLAGSTLPGPNSVTAQYHNLPVYEVVMFALGGTGGGGAGGDLGVNPGALPGVTPAQLNTLNASLTPVQIRDLNNLTACQLQVLLQLPVVNIQLLSNLTPTQIANVVSGLTYTQLVQTATQVSTAQTLVVSSAYPQLYQAISQLLTPAQALAILTNLTSQQLSTLVGLTATQLQTVAQLTVTQIQILTNLTQSQVVTLVGQLTTTQLISVLTTFSTSQLQQLTNVLTATQIQQLLQSVTTAQLQTLVINLSVTQLQTITKYPPIVINYLVNNLTTNDLKTFLDTVPPSLYPGGSSGTSTVTQVAASTSTVTVSNTTTPTSLFGTVVGSLTITAGRLVPGSTVDIKLSGILSTDAAPGVTSLAVTVGGVNALLATGIALAGGLTNAYWTLEGTLTVQTDGAGGSAFVQGEFRYDNAGTMTTKAMKNTTTLGIDTTGTLAIDATVGWGTALAANSFKCTNATIKLGTP